MHIARENTIEEYNAQTFTEAEEGNYSIIVTFFTFCEC